MKTKYYNVNGYAVALTKNTSPIISANIVVNVGSAQEKANEWGLAHMLEHNFFKGTKRRKYKDFLDDCATIGDIGAHTNYTQTTYLFSCLKENIDKGLSLLCEMVFEPSFPEDEFEKEKNVIVDEWKLYQNDPASYFYDVATHDLLQYTGHPILGTKESIETMKISWLHDFIATYYNPDNMVISVVGDFKKKKVLNVLEQLLPKSDRKTKKDLSIVPFLNLNDFHFHHVSDQSCLQFVSPGYSAQAIVDNNFVPSVFHNGFGGGMHSMLFNRIREELGLCYSIYSSHAKWKSFGYNQIFCMLSKKDIDQAKGEIMTLVNKVKQEGFSKELLSLAKSKHLFDLAEGLQTSSQYNGLFDNYFHLNRVIGYEERAEGVAQVTNDDIIKFANKTFDEIKFVSMTPKE